MAERMKLSTLVRDYMREIRGPRTPPRLAKLEDRVVAVEVALRAVRDILGALLEDHEDELEVE